MPLLAIGIIIALLIILFAAQRAGLNAVSGANSAVKAATADEAADYLRSFGWEIFPEPTSIRAAEVPVEFSPAYEDYNAVQQSQGFDLSGYRGQSVTVYTFRVLNHTSPNSVFANVMVHGDVVIAGDIVSYAMDGFLTGL